MNTAHLYTKVAGGWIEAETILPPGPIAGPVALEDGVLAIGSPSQQSVYVFEEQDRAWGHTTTVEDPAPSSGTRFGADVALDGDILAVSDRGSTVHVFDRAGGSWEHSTALDNPDESSNFGASIDVDSGQLIVGSSTARAGTAYIFEPTEEGWKPQAILSPDGFTGGFGKAVAIDDGIAAIGAPWAFPQPFVEIYREVGEAWERQTRLVAEDTSPVSNPAEFGKSVALDDGQLVVGAPVDDPSPGQPASPVEEGVACQGIALTNTCELPGASYVFSETNGAWAQTAKLTPVDGLLEDQFGATVALQDGSTIVGAPEAGSLADATTGAAYSFTQVENLGVP